MRQIDPAQLDRADKKIIEDIETYGWSDICVFPTEESPGLPFNYTVGLLDMQHPDLLILGFDNAQMHGVFCAAVNEIEQGTRYHPDQYYHRVIHDLRVAFVEIDDPFALPYPMSMCRRLYGEISALQLVWPDADDRFPWHDNFDPSMRDFQPLVGTWKGACDE